MFINVFIEKFKTITNTFDLQGGLIYAFCNHFSLGLTKAMRVDERNF